MAQPEEHLISDEVEAGSARSAGAIVFRQIAPRFVSRLLMQSSGW